MKNVAEHAVTDAPRITQRSIPVREAWLGLNRHPLLVILREHQTGTAVETFQVRVLSDRGFEVDHLSTGNSLGIGERLLRVEW